MLISITESCHMGCSHCMDDAKPCEKHMDMQTFKDSIDFLNMYGGVECIITGGEPTDNPLWLDMLEYAVDNFKGSLENMPRMNHITLTTNAMNIAENYDYQKRLAKLLKKAGNRLSIQVTHVDEYYPINVNLESSFFKLNNVIVCKEIEAIYPMGRARTNNIPWQSKCSKCFNIRSTVRAFKDLNKACLALNSAGRFCTPQISYDGYLKLGESCLCPKVARIYDNINNIIESICNFKCRGCDIVNKNLDEHYMKAIGENKEDFI